MKKSYLVKESKEKPYSKMSKLEQLHEKKESKIKEILEHPKKLAKHIKSQIKYNS